MPETQRTLMKTSVLSILILFLAVAGSEAQLNLPWVNPPPKTESPDQGPPARIASSDGTSSVRILQQAMPGTDGVTDFFTLEVLQGEKVVARVPTEGYLISAYWSPDGRLIAVNNRRGNSGDYLWVFALPDGTCIKKADDEFGQLWLSTAIKEIGSEVKSATADSVYRNWLTATGWSASGELQINVRVRFSKAGTFDFAAPALFQNGRWVIQSGVIQAVP